MKKCAMYILLVFFLIGCEKIEIEQEVTVIECAPMPEAVASATAFALNGKGYVISGRHAEKADYVQGMWEYDPQTDTWTTLPNPPFKERAKGAAIVVEDIAYIGLGFNGYIYSNVDSYLRDWWAFDGMKWTRLADFPDKCTNGVVLFEQDKHIYALYGFQHDGKIYCYDIASNRWNLFEKKVGDGILEMMSAVGQTCNGRHFIGTGYNYHVSNVWSEYDIQNECWYKRTALPTKQRCMATATATNQSIYVMGGEHWGGAQDGGFLFNDIWEYQPEKDSWRLRGYFPQGAQNMISFTIGNSVYWGLGEDLEGNRFNTLYKFEE